MPRPFERRSETSERTTPLSKQSGEVGNLERLRNSHRFKDSGQPEADREGNKATLSADLEKGKNMVTITIHCSHCGSDKLKRNGHAPNGKQKYSCKECKKRSRENPTPYAYSKQRREEILRSYEERSSLKGLIRTFGVARNTVSEWLKKSSRITQFK